MASRSLFALYGVKYGERLEVRKRLSAKFREEPTTPYQ